MKKSLIFKVLIGVVALCGLVVTCYFINNYIQDTKSITKNCKLKNGVSADIMINYIGKDKLTSITVIEINNIMEEWQEDLFNRSDEYQIELHLVGDGVTDSQNYEWSKIFYSANKPFRVIFNVESENIKDHVATRNLIIANIENKTLELLTPEFISLNEKNKLKYKKQYYAEKEQEKLAQEAKEYAQTMAYRYDNWYAVPFTNVDFRKCLFKVKGVCFGQPFLAKGMSYMECKAEKDKLGIKQCSSSDDVWAATVKICGGVQNLPTPNELRLLANDMYNYNFLNKEFEEYTWVGRGTRTITDMHGKTVQLFEQGYPVRNEKVRTPRINDKPYIEYFRNVYWNNKNYENLYDENSRNEMYFKIFSNKEMSGDIVTTRSFEKDYSGYFESFPSHRSHRYSEKFNISTGGLASAFPSPISVCVAR